MNQKIKFFFTGSLITFLITLGILIFLKNIGKIGIFWILGDLIFFIIILFLFVKCLWKNEELLKEHKYSIDTTKFIITIIFTLVGTFFAYYITSQLVQPLLYPRIAEIEITPLYIQSDAIKDDFSEIKYYGVYKVDYLIQIPFFDWKIKNKFFELDLPDRGGGSTWRLGYSRSELLAYFLGDNPYYTTNLSEGGAFLDVEKDLQGKIPIKINKTALDVREITATFNFREEIENYNAHLGLSDPEWYSKNQIAPMYFKSEFIAGPETDFLGYIILEPRNRGFRVNSIKIKSLTDFEVKGFAIKENYDYQHICDGEIELEDLNGYVSINVLPRESKTILAFEPIADNGQIKSYEPIFKLEKRTWDGFCTAAWRSYEKWYKDVVPK